MVPVEVLEEGIKIDDFAVSDTGAHAAWIIQKVKGNIKIDFETLETRSLAPSSRTVFKEMDFTE